MASPEVLDFAALLAPIPGDNPAGQDLRKDTSPTSKYQQIRTAWNQARAVMRQALAAENPAAAPRPDWNPVIRLGKEILTEQSKHLLIVQFLLEAMVRTEGFPALRDGFRLIRELCETYWEQLYPLPDEDGVATRVAPLTSLNGDDSEGTLIAPILGTPITKDGRSSQDYKQSLAIEKLDPEKRAKRISEGVLSLGDFTRSVQASGADYYRNLLADLDQAKAEFGKLINWLDDKCGSAAPPTTAIREAMGEVLDTAKSLSKDMLAAAGGNGAADAAGGGELAVSATGGAPQQRGPIATRDDAFNALLLVADFFRRTEPHSPISYNLEQAVRWGRMPLPELLMELLPDEAARSNMFKLVGIRPPEPPAS